MRMSKIIIMRTFWKKVFFDFALNVFFMKELKARSYLKIIGVAWGVAQGARDLSIEMPPVTKI